VSPQLSWANAPEGTKSFAITCYDPDAPTGAGWWHWVALTFRQIVMKLFPKRKSSFKFNARRNTSTTSFGATGFGGPCPPVGHGIHTYFYSLRIKTDNLDATANPELVGYNLWANTIAKATIVAHYKR
jgi:Raf kinase inhibitor-like YbhB/YbcL family protein